MTAARVFGLAGLIPFLALAGAAAFGPGQWHTVAQVLLVQYGALILAFVGALHWGYALLQEARGGQAWLRYGYSVLPALWAWLALQFPLPAGMRMVGLALLVCLVVDLVWRQRLALPAWFIRLRAILTAGGSASLLMASAV